MNHYVENIPPKLKPGLAFVLALGSFVLLSLITYALPFEEYKVFCDIFLILCTVAIIYFLNRYALTPYEYSISGNCLTICKGEKRHKKIVAIVKMSEIRLFCPSNYTGKVPGGDWDNLNCCPNLKGKQNGWTLYCHFKDGKRIKLYMEPTDGLINLLNEKLKDKSAAEDSAEPTD